MPTLERTHNLANVDISDLSAIRKELTMAHAVGHWRRILAIYGDHLPVCAARREEECDCGWAEAFD